jgi:hypothetical protein
MKSLDEMLLKFPELNVRTLHEPRGHGRSNGSPTMGEFDDDDGEGCSEIALVLEPKRER